MSVKEILEEHLAEQECKLSFCKSRYESLFAMYSSSEDHGGISPDTLEKARVEFKEQESLTRYVKSGLEFYCRP
jgi:hypothetical protein